MSKTIDEIRRLKAEMDEKIAISITDAVAEFERESGLEIKHVESGFHDVYSSDERVDKIKRACVTSTIEWGI